MVLSDRPLLSKLRGSTIHDRIRLIVSFRGVCRVIYDSRNMSQRYISPSAHQGKDILQTNFHLSNMSNNVAGGHKVHYNAAATSPRNLQNPPRLISTTPTPLKNPRSIPAPFSKIWRARVSSKIKMPARTKVILSEGTRLR